MAAAASSARSSNRASQQPLSFAEEQAAATLSLLEQRDLAAALRLSLNDDWNSDEEKSGADSDDNAEAPVQSDEEALEDAAAVVEAGGWTSNLHDIDLPLHRLRHPRQQSPSEETPLQLLQRFLPQSLMEEFARHTNAAAPHDWRPTTADELYAFLGVHLFMGIARLPRTEMYWSHTFANPLVTSLFSRDRFKQLLRFFRVVAPDEAAADRNPLPHVRSLAAKLNASFAANYTPSQHLALDEAMVAYKGRSPIKQYIPSKPHKWGYKIWCLSSDDYLLHFEIYGGKEGAPSDAGATIDTVLRMTAVYQQRQHVLYTDSWFTSPALLDALAQRGIRLCGSVRSNRKGMPAIPAEEVQTLNRGEWLQRQKGDVTVAVWRDQRCMWLLYNHCSPGESSSLERWNDFGRKVSVGCPRAIRDYFYRARSVDVLSQLHYAYPPGRKAQRCWPRLAWWLLDMCVINAFQLWSKGQQHRGQLRFREELMHELLQQLPADVRPREHGAHPPPPHAAAAIHSSELAPRERDCKHCSHRPGNRKRTNYICSACQVHLCLGQCFRTYHAGV
jgi:Transposase IS4/DDE_Tnp_1-like zinc-ribbon